MLAALALCAGLFTTLDFGARTELRLREATGFPLALDFATFPYARLESKSHHVDLKADYAAMLTLPDLEAGLQAPQLYQLADVSAWYAIKHWVAGVSEAGGYGDMNFSYLSPVPVTPGQPSAGPPPVNLIPCTDAAHCASETVHYGTTSTTGLLRWSETRTSLAVAPSYTVGGGLDAASQALVPLVSQPRLDVVIEHKVTRRDVVVTEGDATLADSTPRACDPATGGPAPVGVANPPLCAPHEQWVGLREKWRRLLQRRVWMELSAGAVVAHATINADASSANPAQPYKLVGYPDASATFGYTLQSTDPDRPLMHPIITDPPKPSFYAFSHLGPIIDTRFGIIDPRFQVGVGVLDPIGPSYTFNAHASFVRSVPPTVLDATYVDGWAEILRRIDKYRFEAGGGVRAAYQRDPLMGEFFVASFYITLVWHEPRIKL